MVRWASVVLVVAAGCATEGKPQRSSPANPPAARPAPTAYPPAVLSGEGVLRCDISSRTNGRQILKIVKGGGLEFDAVVSPLIDGTVTTQGPDKGGVYKFTSHLARPAKGQILGQGALEIDELETRVQVEMDPLPAAGWQGDRAQLSLGRHGQPGHLRRVRGQGPRPGRQPGDVPGEPGRAHRRARGPWCQPTTTSRRT
jgi:hypothetical protein